MPERVFQDDEEGYNNWLSLNNDGYVVNSYKKIKTSYLVLHKASCPSISLYNKMSKPGGFTERRFIKVCATQKNDLLVWIKTNKGKDFSAYCRVCNP